MSSSSRPPDIFSMLRIHHFMAPAVLFISTSEPLLNYQEPYSHALFLLPFFSIFSILPLSSPLLLSTTLCGITGSFHGFFFFFFIVVEMKCRKWTYTSDILSASMVWFIMLSMGFFNTGKCLLLLSLSWKILIMYVFFIKSSHVYPFSSICLSEIETDENNLGKRKRRRRE